MKIKYFILIFFLAFSSIVFCLEDELDCITLELYTDEGNPFYISKQDKLLYVRCYTNTNNKKECQSYHYYSFKENNEWLKPGKIINVYISKPYRKKLGKSFNQIMRYYLEFEDKINCNCNCIIL